MEKISRKTMRKIAVDCIYSYDFVLSEKKANKPMPEKEPVQKEKPKTITVYKQVNGGRIPKVISMEEYEKNQAKIAEIYPDIVKKEEPKKEEPVAPEKFDVENFVLNILESSGYIQDGLFEEDKIRTQPDYEDYLLKLVNCVIDNIDEIDNQISANIKNYTINRLDKSDLAVLRVAACEIIYLENIPCQVTANEAVEIAKNNSEKSGKFVNGVIAGIIRNNNIK